MSNYTTIAIDGTPTDAQLERAQNAGYELLQRGDEYYFIKPVTARDVAIGTRKETLRAPDGQAGFEWHESYYERGVRKIRVHKIADGDNYVAPKEPIDVTR